jgi:TRAP-type C4-dicarboxylate transport system substrate-binding protein
VPPTHVIWTDVIAPWTREVAKQSNNQLTVRMFPAMQLGGRPPELYRQVVQGISDITFTLPGYTSSDFPMMALTELPGTPKVPTTERASSGRTLTSSWRATSRIPRY